MKQEVIEIAQDSFKDYAGHEREFIVAAVSMPATENTMKSVGIGFAICGPEDTFNKELGVKIAINKAKSSNGFRLYASKDGMINSKVVKALIEQEIEYFKQNPASHIANYNNLKYKYLKNKQEQENVENVYCSLTTDEKNVFSILKSFSDEVINKILYLRKNIEKF